jgi:hypothetical protein
MRPARGQAGRVKAIRYTRRLAGRTEAVSPGVLRRTELELPDGARLESEVLFADDCAFREQGRITLAAGNDLYFRTLGIGSLVPSPEPGLRHGTVTWELDGGSGRFEHASGRITSSFTLTDDGEVADEQHGLIFLHDNREENP